MLKHPSGKRLIAFRDDPSQDQKVHRHLASCDTCQQALNDSRWQRVLSGPHGASQGPHVPRDRLMAFWEGALAPDSAKQVQDHLAACDSCAALYARLRDLDPARTYASPAPELLRVVRRSYRQSSGRSLGLLILRQLGKALELVYSPGEAGRAGLHPSSATARRQRRLGNRADFGEFEAARNLVDPAGETVQIDGAGLAIRIAGTREDGKPCLNVAVRSASTGEPVKDVAVQVWTDKGAKLSARTSARGQAILNCPPGRSLLRVGGRRAVWLKLQGLF